MTDWREIPLSSNAHHFTQECQLFGRLYQVELEWIERECIWIFHVRNALEEPVALGVKLMVDWPMVVNDADRQMIFLLRPKIPKAFLDMKTLVYDFSLLVSHAAI